MMKNNIKEVIESYMEQITEPFCSEADFQFSLALFLKEKLSEFEVILEYPTSEKSNNIYIDICLVNKNSQDKYYIELKYKTSETDIKRHGIQNIRLKPQMAQDLGRYFFIKDIQRIEQSADIKGGFCLLLTNDHLYYDDNKSHKETLDKMFRINKGCEIKGILSWEVGDKNNHWTNNYPCLEITTNYKCEWKDCLEKDYTGFKYLLFQIEPKL